MKLNRNSSRFGFLGFACLAAAALTIAAELPQREKLERGGWTIEFSPDDRAAADGLAARMNYLEKRLVEARAANAVLGPEEFEARGAELAVKIAQLCALPARAREVEAEFAQLATALKEVRRAMHEVFFPRALAIWRPREVRQRLQDGERIAGFVLNPRDGNITLSVKFSSDIAADYRVTTTGSLPAAITLKQEDDAVARTSVAELMKQIDDWIAQGRGYCAAGLDRGLVTGVKVGLGRILGTELGSNQSDRWIKEGVMGWAWREAMLQTLPWKIATRYAAVVPQLPVPVGSRDGSQLRLQEWPEANDGDHSLFAIQVFCSVGERHGVDTVTRLLTEFWRRPIEERTTETLKEIYRDMMNEPLEIQAPWRSLGRATHTAPPRMEASARTRVCNAARLDRSEQPCA